MKRLQNEDIRGTAHAEWFGGKVREARLRWVGMCRRGVLNILDKGCINAYV